MNPRTPVLIAIAGLAAAAGAYDNLKAHPALNEAIVARFAETARGRAGLNLATFQFDREALTGPAVVDTGWFSVTTRDAPKTPRQWIAHGGFSADEPEAPAAYRHFFDPTAAPGAAYLSDTPGVSQLKDNPRIDAIRWHFIGDDPSLRNAWTWNAGKGFVVQALTSVDDAARNRLMAKAYRCLGETLHNTADMACPPHVRNDAHGGRGLGGPDPYESLFDPAWVPTLAELPPSDAARAAAAQPTAIEVNRALAAYTNARFFTQDTIAGTAAGVAYTPANGKPAYAAPRLETLKYDPKTYVFYREEAVGRGRRRIDLANDYGLLSSIFGSGRTTPAVTAENVRSQAADLVPALVEAGAAAMDRFYPRFRIELRLSPDRKRLDGEVVHVPTPEYPKPIAYQGPIRFFRDSALTTTIVPARAGKFVLTNPPSGEVRAFFAVGGYQVESARLRVDAPAAPRPAGLVDYVSFNLRFAGPYIADETYADGKRTHDEKPHELMDANNYSNLERTGPSTWAGSTSAGHRLSLTATVAVEGKMATVEFRYVVTIKTAAEESETVVVVRTKPMPVMDGRHIAPGAFSCTADVTSDKNELASATMTHRSTGRYPGGGSRTVRFSGTAVRGSVNYGRTKPDGGQRPVG